MLLRYEYNKAAIVVPRFAAEIFHYIFSFYAIMKIGKSYLEELGYVDYKIIASIIEAAGRKLKMKLSFEYGTQTIEFDVEYKKRKTLGISITPPDVINVKAPVGVGEDSVLEMVKSKAKWIAQKLYEIKHLECQKRNRQYVNGESFLYMGADYPLHIIYDEAYQKPLVNLENGSFYVYTVPKGEECIKSALADWYKHKAREKICERIEYYQPCFDISPAQIKVKEQKKRWGSCTSKRVLLFNWRIIMAPLNVMDYIIVHEMCHLVHMNHSKEFWNLVKSILPDYEERKLWLKMHGVRMNL